MSDELVKVKIIENETLNFWVSISQLSLAVIAAIALIFTFIQISRTFRPIIFFKRSEKDKDYIIIENIGNRPAYHIKYGNKKDYLTPLKAPLYPGQKINLEISSSSKEYILFYSRFKFLGKNNLFKIKEIHFVQKEGEEFSHYNLSSNIINLMRRELNKKFIYSSFEISKDKYFLVQLIIRQISSVNWINRFSIDENYRKSEKDFLKSYIALPYESNLKLSEELIFLGFKIKENDSGIEITGFKKLHKEWKVILININDVIGSDENYFQIKESMKGYKKMSWIKGVNSGESNSF